MLEHRLKEYALDPENPETNYNLAIEYLEIGQTAAAISYFLRCADRSVDDLELAYECLIHIGKCFDTQGNRLAHAYGAFMQAISILPKRPEAYYFLSRIKNWTTKYEEGYYHVCIALQVCDFENLKPLRNLSEYTGIHCLFFEKALSSWHWGKVEQCKNMFLDLYNHYWDKLSEYQKNITKEYLKKHYQIELDDTNKEKIPVIGVPILNGVHWIKRLIESVDYPVKDFLILNNNGRGQIDEELNEICKTKHDFIDHIKVVHLPSNLGCPASWNLVIKSYILEPYWILATHDIKLSPGMLQSMVQASKDSECGMVHAKKSGWKGGSYDIFILKDWVVEKCGLFDENLYPAYAEDVDYHIRLLNENIPVRILDIDYLHGDIDYEKTGSQTWRTEPELKDRIDKFRLWNIDTYLSEKWGVQYKSLEYPTGYIGYKNPYNNTSYKVSYQDYNIEAIRKKHLGF
jgi:hypothetical protein